MRFLTDGVPVALYGRVGVLELNELVPHQSPGGEVVWIELESTLEVSHGLLVLGPKGVVVPYHATRLSAVPERD